MNEELSFLSLVDKNILFNSKLSESEEKIIEMLFSNKKEMGDLSSQELMDISELIRLCGIYKEFLVLIYEINDLIWDKEKINLCVKKSNAAIKCFVEIINNPRCQVFFDKINDDSDRFVKVLDLVISRELAIDDNSSLINTINTESETLSCMMGKYLKEIINNMDDKSENYINIKKKINAMSNLSVFDINIYRLSLFMDNSSEYYEKYEEIFNRYVSTLNNNIKDIKSFGLEINEYKTKIMNVMSTYLDAKKKRRLYNSAPIVLTGISLVATICALNSNYQKVTTESFVNNNYEISEVYVPDDSNVYNGIYVDVYGDVVDIVVNNKVDQGVVVNRYDASGMGIDDIYDYEKIDMNKLNKLVSTLIVNVPDNDEWKEELVRISKITSEEVTSFEKETGQYIFIIIYFSVIYYLIFALLNKQLFGKKIDSYVDVIKNMDNDIDKCISLIELLGNEINDNNKLMEKFKEFYINKDYIFNDIDKYKNEYCEIRKWFDFEQSFDYVDYNYFINRVKKRTKYKK